MSWLARLGLAPEVKAATATSRTAMERAAGASGFFSVAGSPYQSDWNLDRAVREGLQRSVWVFRCVDVIASNQARLPLEVRRGSETGDVVEDKRLAKILNRRANPAETAAQFRYRVSGLLLLSKMGVFIEVVAARDGRPAQLTILPPGSTKPIPDPAKPAGVSGYRVDLGNGESYDLRPDQVIWIRHRNHPTDFYEQLTPLEAAGLTVDVDFYARLFNRNFMLNDGRPGGLVAVKGQLGRDDAAEIKRRFQGGPGSAGRTTVIEADDVSWVDTATSPRDAQYSEMMSLTKQDILLAFGVPESVMGNASGRTYDNAEAEENLFWRATMLPHLDALAGGLDVLTEGGLDDEDYVVFDTSTVSALQLDKRRRDKEALEKFQAGLMTIKQYYEATGEDLPSELDVPAARVLWLPTAKVPAGAEEDTLAAAALMPVGTPPQEEAPAEGEPEEEEDELFADPGGFERGGLAYAGGMLEELSERVDTSDSPNVFKSLKPEDLTDAEFRDVMLLGTKTLADVVRARAHA